MRGVVGVHAIDADAVAPAADFDDLVDAGVFIAGRRVVGDGASGSRRLMSACIVAAERLPDGVPWVVNSSLASDQMATLAWLRSRRTSRSRRSRLAASLPSRRLSSMTSMPTRSAASRSSGVGGFVGGAVGVAAHLFEPLEAERLHAVRQRDADAGVVLVVASAADDVRPSVEQEARLASKANVRRPNVGGDAIDDATRRPRPR